MFTVYVIHVLSLINIVQTVNDTPMSFDSACHNWHEYLIFGKIYIRELIQVYDL